MTLHLLALAPAAVGLCCLAADRRRARAAEVVAAMLMMMAMVDAAVTKPSVYEPTNVQSVRLTVAQ